MSVESVAPPELVGSLITFLNANRCKRIAMSSSGVTERLGLAEALRSVGFTATSWNELTTDALYDYDCGLTGTWAAVAETGSLVLRGSVDGDRLLSLVPNVHVAIVEQQDLLPDLVDLFERLSQESQPSPDTVIITGPSKTADIEMNLVTGVHGPGVVHVLLLS
jgi:L-lactate dehydrogenase complex protein LldG